jgi:hypothetical protein
MSRIRNEVEFVANAGDGLVLIHYEQVWEDGVNLGGDFVCEASAAGWLADRIEAAADPWGAPDVDEIMLPDHFIIFSRGGEHGEDTNVHLHNLREPSAPRGGTYALSGIWPGVAKSVAAQLRALNPPC